MNEQAPVPAIKSAEEGPMARQCRVCGKAIRALDDHFTVHHAGQRLHACSLLCAADLWTAPWQYTSRVG